MRDDMRAEARSAAERAAQIMGHGFDPLTEEGEDKFYIDPTKIPADWSYEWKTETVYGAEDPSRMVNYARTGWEPVPASRHPEMMPRGASPQEPIRLDGQILMERPQVITDQVRQREHNKATAQLRSKMAQNGQTPDGQHDRCVLEHKSEFRAPIAVPE